MAKKKAKKLSEFELRVQKESQRLHDAVGVERAISTNQHTLKRAIENNSQFSVPTSKEIEFLEAVDAELKTIWDKENR